MTSSIAGNSFTRAGAILLRLPPYAVAKIRGAADPAYLPGNRAQRTPYY